jgi:tetratricopeptide (TPR) repeat protein
LIVLPHQYRLATASRDLLRHTGTAALASGDFASSAGRLYDFLAQPQYQHWDFDSRMLIGQSILPRFLGRLPTVKETVIGLSIYLVCILAPLGAIALVAVEKPKLFNALSPLKVNAAAAPAPAMSFRQQAEIRLAAATGPLLRLSLLADIVKEAEQADETGDQLHFAKMLHAEAGERLPSTVQHASAALTLAKALRAQEDNGDDEKSWSEAARLLSEAESLLRAGLAKQDDSMAALILADVLVERQRGTGDEARIALLGEVVKLHADHALQSATRLPLARTGLAQALDEAGRTAQAEEQFRFAAVDIERLRQETKHGGDALALNHATFLMANDRSEEAMARLSRLLGKSVGLGSGYWSLERQAHLLAAVAARDRGDWRGVGDRAGAVKTVRELSGGNLLSPTYTEPRLDLRGALLLLEAERKLGRVQQAEELMAGVRAQYESKAGGARRCRSDDETDRWRKIITDAVAEIEKQEFNCEPTPALRQTGIVGDA